MKASLSTGFGNIWPNICSCSDFFRSSPLLSDSEKFPLNCSSQTNIVSDVPKDMAMSPLCIRKPANELQISSIYHFMMFTSCFPKDCCDKKLHDNLPWIVTGKCYNSTSIKKPVSFCHILGYWTNVCLWWYRWTKLIS